MVGKLQEDSESEEKPQKKVEDQETYRDFEPEETSKFLEILLIILFKTYYRCMIIKAQLRKPFKSET